MVTVHQQDGYDREAMSGPSRLDLGALLAAAEDAAPVDAIDVVAENLLQALGATEVSFLIADFSGGALVRLGHTSRHNDGGRETAEQVLLAGTPHERAIRGQTVIVDEARVFAPVTNRGEAIGLLELTLPHPPDEAALAAVSQAAHLLAYVVIANRRFTDLFEWGRRSVELSLAAEIQQRLLPGTYTCEAGQFTLAAWLEPAGDIAGDTFDFSMERDVLHLSMTDAMGHEVQAAMLATVLVSALRNARRSRGTLADQVRLTNEALCKHLDMDEFVTGLVARIDLRHGTATIVNAGHPLPLRLRGGKVETVELKADPPFGVSPQQNYRVQRFPLVPGDRLILLTDGMLERNVAGIDINSLLLQGAHLHPREAVQQLVQAVVESAAGPLEDDATVLCIDWHGGPKRQRTSEAGSDQ